MSWTSLRHTLFVPRLSFGYWQDIKAADWSENVAPFWPAVIKSALTWRGFTSVLRSGKLWRAKMCTTTKILRHPFSYLIHWSYHIRMEDDQGCIGNATDDWRIQERSHQICHHHMSKTWIVSEGLVQMRISLGYLKVAFLKQMAIVSVWDQQPRWSWLALAAIASFLFLFSFWSQLVTIDTSHESWQPLTYELVAAGTSSCWWHLISTERIDFCLHISTFIPTNLGLRSSWLIYK